jgi:lipoprotein-anchoring transpeptidase ErfK/SrfK
VEKAHLNAALPRVLETGRLGEVTVPFTQSLYKNSKEELVKLYRLYFQSMHWITGLVDGPDGKPWYRLTDEWLGVHYYVPAQDVRPLSADEFEPLAPTAPESEKLIEVSLEKQILTAYQFGIPVFQTSVSTGRRYMETPTGKFLVNRKYPSKHMGDGGITSDLNAYELVGVPWVSFFHDNGIAFHGTFWHDNFGAPMSQGCVNMRNEDARWLFRWCSPAYDPGAQFKSGYKRVGSGTRVVVS